MKYGDSLPQWSIPGWGAREFRPSSQLWHIFCAHSRLVDNVDYNEIKQLIKRRTTEDKAHAISIPGKDDGQLALSDFENELYGELCQQYQRIDLFVQSKTGEIKRKLSKPSCCQLPANRG